jgi:hypothetical protein
MGSKCLGSCQCLISANKLTPKCQEDARRNEAAGMTRRDAKLRCGLAERQAEPPKAIHRQQAV